LIDDFINRSKWQEKVTDDLPELKEILRRNVWRDPLSEQVMQIANRLGGIFAG